MWGHTGCPGVVVKALGCSSKKPGVEPSEFVSGGSPGAMYFRETMVRAREQGIPGRTRGRSRRRWAGASCDGHVGRRLTWGPQGGEEGGSRARGSH